MPKRKNKISSPLKEWVLNVIAAGGFFMLFLPLLGVLIEIAVIKFGNYPQKWSAQVLFFIPVITLIWLFSKTYLKMVFSRKTFIANVSKSRSKFNINLMRSLASQYAPGVSLKISVLADCCYFIGTIFMHHKILQLPEKVIRFITLHELAHHIQFKTVKFACPELHHSLCVREDQAFIELLDLFGEDALLEVDADFYAIKNSGFGVEDMRTSLKEVSKLQGMELTGLTKEYLDLRVLCVQALLREALTYKN